MAYTTCTFWIKFFIFLALVSLVAGLFGIICPSCIPSNTIIAGFICSPILFANQIYKLTKKVKSVSRSVSQVNNKKWLHENYDILTNVYENMFVAVYNEEIIDGDTNLAPLRTRIQELIMNQKNVYIEFINPKKMADEYEKLK